MGTTGRWYQNTEARAAAHYMDYLTPKNHTHVLSHHHAKKTITFPVTTSHATPGKTHPDQSTGTFKASGTILSSVALTSVGS